MKLFAATSYKHPNTSINAYWRKLKKEGNETVTNGHALKMQAAGLEQKTRRKESSNR